MNEKRLYVIGCLFDSNSDGTIEIDNMLYIVASKEDISKHAELFIIENGVVSKVMPLATPVNASPLLSAAKGKVTRLKELQQIEFESVWAEYEGWGWKRRSDWTFMHSQSACRRKKYIEEQREFAKEKRQAELMAERLFARVEAFFVGLVEAGVIRVVK